jgi:SAM-dependent methyltransferase
VAVSWFPEARDCPACGSGVHELLGRRGGASHHAGLGVETGIVRCQTCHLVYPRPFLIPDGNPYASHAGEEYFHAHPAREREEQGRSLARATVLRLGRKGRLLELGCGRGDLLRGALREGFEVFGVDLTPAYAAASPDLAIEVASAATARSLEGTYEAIWLAAILEHLSDPGLILRRVASALVDDGVLFVDVPNECSLWTRVGNAYMRLRGRPWAVNLSPTFPPYHVVGFCPRSLRTLLEASGFEAVEIRTPRWSNELPRRPGLGARLERLAGGMVLTLGAWVGMGAGIACWARKRAGGRRS